MNSGLLCFVLLDSLPLFWLGAWLAAIWAVTGFRALVWLRYRRGPVNITESRNIGQTLTVAAIISGFVWGVPGMLVIPSEPMALQGFIVFVLGGMSAGAVSTLASHLPAFFGFVTPALLPIIGRMLAEESSISLAMGVMGLVYFWVVAAAGYNLNRTLTRSLCLQFEKSDLADDLSAAQANAEGADRAKAQFLATISHELRTPLNAVLGFAELLKSEIHGPLGHSKYKEYLHHVAGSGTHLLTLINELLDLSRAEAGRLELSEREVDLAALLRSCAEIVEGQADQLGVQLRCRADWLPALRADPGRLRQILLNVLSNAIKFTPQGGHVEIFAESTSSGAVTIYVRDSGVGMSEDEVTTAMQFFGRLDSSYDRATEGAGIGLPFTALLMEMHGGDMTIDSTPGGGTEVVLNFPAERVIDPPTDDWPRAAGAGSATKAVGSDL